MLRLLILMTLAQLPPSPDPRPVPIRGVVVDAPGRPVAEADVWLTDALPPDEGRRFGLERWWSSLTGPGEGRAPIVVHARTGNDGTFALEIPAEAVARRSPPPLAVWALSRQGQQTRVASRRLPGIILSDDPPVRIELGPPARTELTVLTPGREPAVGARALPTRVGEVPVPEPLGRLLAAVADSQGRAAIEGLVPPAPSQVRVEVEGFGVQMLEVPDAKTSEKGHATRTIALAPVGRIRGRLTAPHDEPIRGATVRATSQVGGYNASGQAGSVRAACDEQGRFAIPAIAAGMVMLDLEFDPAADSSLRGEAPTRLVVRAGQTVEVTLPLRETVVVRGQVREKETDRPIPGVKVALNGRRGGDRFAVTDAAGRFAGRILRDETQPFGWPIRDPLPFYEPDDFPNPPQRMPRSGVFELNLPPAALRRGADVRGTVAGEDGRSVAGATIEARWHDSRDIDQSALARTDRAGGFVLHGISPLAELELNAWDGFAAASTKVRAATTADRPVALMLSPKGTVPIGGRVVDPDGRPIAGATVRIRRQVRGKDARIFLDEPVAAVDGTFVLRTGTDGRYRAHGRLPARAEYYAEASASGRLAARSTPAVAAQLSDKPTVLVLRRVRTVEGRVVDRGGRPVAGAVVRQSGDGPMPTETPTDADGRFHLPGVIEGPVVIVTAGAGFRSSLRTVDDESKPVGMVLARRDEPPAVSYRTLPPTLPVAEEKALALRLIEPLAATVLAHGDDRAKYQFLADASDVDPQATIEWLGEVKFGAPSFADEVRDNVAAALARESIDDATAILEAGTGANTRAYGYARLVELAPDLPRERRRAFLDQALLHSKNVNPPVQRFSVLGVIAERLIDLGDVERARAVLNEAKELAGNIGRENTDARRLPLYIAVALSRLDLPAALKIVEDLQEDARKNEPGDRSRIYDRYYGLIAYGLADHSPADAEKVLDRMTIRPTNDRAIVAVCTRMASKDLARARRIAATRISPGAPALRAYALGLMARAVATTDRAAAVRLLNEAFDELGRLAAVELERAEPRASVAAAALLPVVEAIEPDRMADFLGRALLLRGARGDQARFADNGAAHATARLAMLTARYDRGMAAHLLQPVLDHLGSYKTSFGTDYISPSVLTALALIDPRRAVAMVETLPEDPAPGTDPNATKGQARRFVARTLALHGDERWRMVSSQFLYLWTPDQKLQ